MTGNVVLSSAAQRDLAAIADHLAETNLAVALPIGIGRAFAANRRDARGGEPLRATKS